jgi:hypothetical protein
MAYHDSDFPVRHDSFKTTEEARLLAGLNNIVKLSPIETSRPVSRIEYEQRGRIEKLERELEDAKKSGTKVTGATSLSIPEMFSLCKDWMKQSDDELYKVREELKGVKTRLNDAWDCAVERRMDADKCIADIKSFEMQRGRIPDMEVLAIINAYHKKQSIKETTHE